MTVREILLERIRELPEEDIAALLGVAERLRGRAASSPATSQKPPAPSTPRPNTAPLAGSILFMGDIESPVIEAAAWTHDEENV